MFLFLVSARYTCHLYPETCNDMWRNTWIRLVDDLTTCCILSWFSCRGVSDGTWNGALGIMSATQESVAIGVLLFFSLVPLVSRCHVVLWQRFGLQGGRLEAMDKKAGRPEREKPRNGMPVSSAHGLASACESSERN